MLKRHLTERSISLSAPTTASLDMCHTNQHLVLPNWQAFLTRVAHTSSRLAITTRRVLSDLHAPRVRLSRRQNRASCHRVRARRQKWRKQSRPGCDSGQCLLEGLSTRRVRRPAGQHEDPHTAGSAEGGAQRHSTAWLHNRLRHAS